MSESLQPHGLQPAWCLCPCGFYRQEYWSVLPRPPPRALPNPRIEPRSLALQVDSLLSEPPGKPSSTLVFIKLHFLFPSFFFLFILSFVNACKIKVFTFLHKKVLYLNFQFSSVQSLSRVQVFATPWTAARQASLSFTIS